MQQLVDARRFDELLRVVSLAEVAHAWMRYQHKVQRGEDPGADDPDWWAVEMWMEDASWADEQRLRDGVLELVAAAETDQDFEIIGAGVLEYVINDDEDRLRWLEAEAKKSEPFRRSMANMNVWGAHRDAVAARVEAAAGVRLPRPRNWNGPQSASMTADRRLVPGRGVGILAQQLGSNVAKRRTERLIVAELSVEFPSPS